MSQVRLALLDPDADDAVIDGFLAALGVRTERAKDPDDHYYGAWSGGSKKEGGHPEGEAPKTNPYAKKGYEGVRIVHHSVDPDPYGEKMDLEAATRMEARSADDTEAVDMYQSTRWIEINDRLRAGDPLPADAYEGGLGRNTGHSPASDAARMDAMMTSEGGMPYETDVWRGVHSDYVFPHSDMTGTSFTDLGYVSTTANKDTAEGFSFPGGGLGGNTIVRIRVPKGAPAVLAEGEVILRRGTTFHVVSDTFGSPSGYVTNEPTGFEHIVKRVIVAEVRP